MAAGGDGSVQELQHGVLRVVRRRYSTPGLTCADALGFPLGAVRRCASLLVLMWPKCGPVALPGSVDRHDEHGGNPMDSTTVRSRIDRLTTDTKDLATHVAPLERHVAAVADPELELCS